MNLLNTSRLSRTGRLLLSLAAVGSSSLIARGGEAIPPTKAPVAENVAEAPPVKQTERSVMFRRLCIDILGRMPTAQEMDEFLNDKSPEAYGKAVNRLLLDVQKTTTRPVVSAGHIRVVSGLQDKAAIYVTQQEQALQQKARAEMEVLNARLQMERERAEAHSTYARLAAGPGQENPWVRAAVVTPKIKVAYVGVGVDVPSETVRSQLRLEPGAGLVVNYVEEDGPAAKLVQVHDVLQKLDDQILVNGEQLVTLVRMHKKDDTIKLTLVRQAKPITVEVKLGERETTVSSGENADVQPTDQAAVHINWLAAAGPQRTAAMTYNPVSGTLVFHAARTEPVRINDGRLTIMVPADDGQEMTVQDSKTGKMIYRGPVLTGESDPHAKQLTPEVRDSILGWQKAVLQRGGALLFSDPATQPTKANE